MTEFIFQPFKVYRKVEGKDKVDMIFKLKGKQEVVDLRGVENFLTAVARGIARVDTKLESKEVGAPVLLVKEKGEFVIENEE